MSQGGVLGKEGADTKTFVREFAGQVVPSNPSQYFRFTNEERLALLDGVCILFDYSVSVSVVESTTSIAFGLSTVTTRITAAVAAIGAPSTTEPLAGQICLWKQFVYKNASQVYTFACYFLPSNSSIAGVSLPYTTNDLWFGITNGATATSTISYTIKLYAITL